MMDLVVNDRMGFGAMFDGLFGKEPFSGLVVTPYAPEWMVKRVMHMVRRAPRPLHVVRRGHDVFIQCGPNAIRFEGYYDGIHHGSRHSVVFLQEFDGCPYEHMYTVLKATRNLTNERLIGITG